MKSNAAIVLAVCSLAACTLAACSPREGNAGEDSTAESPKPALQRLVGTLSIVEDHAIKDKSGVPFTTRRMVVQGKIDQVVEVTESSDHLDLDPEGGGRLTMRGTVLETGRIATDTPDSNSIVRIRGESSYTGQPGEYELSIIRSKLGRGDELHLRFNTPMEGKMVVNATHRNGQVTDMGESGNLMGQSLLEPNPSDGKPMFKRDYALFPKLGEVPADPFAKQLHEGIRKYPAMFHLGLVTSPGRSAWTYAGTKVYSKPGSETAWTEKVEISLKLVPR